MSKRILFPYKDVRRQGKDYAHVKKHPVYPLPCVIGQRPHRKGRLVIIWIDFQGDIGIVKSREKASIFKTQQQVEAIIDYAGAFTGFTNIFVEKINT